MPSSPARFPARRGGSLAGTIGFREASGEVAEFDDVRVTSLDGSTVLFEEDFSGGLEQWVRGTTTREADEYTLARTVVDVPDGEIVRARSYLYLTDGSRRKASVLSSTLEECPILFDLLMQATRKSEQEGRFKGEIGSSLLKTNAPRSWRGYRRRKRRRRKS